jgi:hypothetical protein
MVLSPPYVSSQTTGASLKCAPYTSASPKYDPSSPPYSPTSRSYIPSSPAYTHLTQLRSGVLHRTTYLTELRSELAWTIIEHNEDDVPSLTVPEYECEWCARRSNDHRSNKRVICKPRHKESEYSVEQEARYGEDHPRKNLLIYACMRTNQSESW